MSNELTVVGGVNDALIPMRELFANMQATQRMAQALSVLSKESVDITMAKILYGAELGVTPFTACRSIHMIQNRPALSTDLIVGLAKSIGIKFEVEHSTPPGEWCRVKGTRGEENYEMTWTFEMAKKAGLTNKDNWKNYPWDMLYARAASNVCRRLAPDRLSNVYMPEELESVTQVESDQPKRSFLQRIDDPPVDVEAEAQPDPAAVEAERNSRLRAEFAALIEGREEAALSVLRTPAKNGKAILTDEQGIKDIPTVTLIKLMNGKREGFLAAVDGVERSESALNEIDAQVDKIKAKQEVANV